MDNRKSEGDEITESCFFEFDEFEEVNNLDNSDNHKDNDISSSISNNESCNIPNNDLELEIDGNICDICYIEKGDLNTLECCKNTKKICNECIECLKTPICPYCRQSLPLELKKSFGPSSCPADFGMSNWMNNESRYMLIDPYDPEYEDSRVLRRQIRRMRRNYYRTRNGGGLYSKREKIDYRRYKRRQLRNQTREIMHRFNQNGNSNLDNISFDD